MVPLPLDTIREKLKNLRTATLELDSLYGPPAPRDPANRNRMLLGRVTPLHGSEIPTLRPRGKGDDNDLPREPRTDDIRHDRAARIGDPRNDENLIVGQLHLAFLKAHNRLVGQGSTFAQARRVLRQHYQHIVIHDFLKRVADPKVVDRILEHGNRVYDALAEPFFLPLEFTVAGYRFGHTMIRDDYDFNINFNRGGEPASPATLDLLFTFTALSGQLGEFDTLPDNWIIEWQHFVDTGTGAANKARRIDTKLAGGLFDLRDLKGEPQGRPTGRGWRCATCCAATGCGCRPAKPSPSTCTSSPSRPGSWRRPPPAPSRPRCSAMPRFWNAPRCGTTCWPRPNTPTAATVSGRWPWQRLCCGYG
jgi:hypothetical protein